MRTTGEGSVIIVPAAPPRSRNSDVEYPYRQSSDFHYLCGFPEPHAVLVLAPGRKVGESLLFCRVKDPDREIWDGAMVGLDGARSDFAMDDAFPIDDIDDILPNLIDGSDKLYYSIGEDRDFDQQVMGWVKQVRREARRGAHPPDEFITLDHTLHDMRMYKNRAELKSLKKAARIGAAAHCRAMRVCRPGLTEYQLAAELHYTFNRENTQPSYPPIVGGGANACVLHYITNQDTLRDGDLVLIDAGAEYDHYASDITRTFPVNGRFSDAQRALYEVVLAAQHDAIAAVRPGAAVSDSHDAAVRTITAGLVELGILTGDVDTLIENEDYKPYFMHKTGHWLGMDVHDVGDYQVDHQPRELERGMVLTVEPGVYVAPDAEGVADRWRGLGIRIEDDVAVTADGYQVLSTDVPKAIDDIEALMAEPA